MIGSRPSFFARWSRVIRARTTHIYINNREAHGKEAEDVMKRMNEFSRELNAAFGRLFPPFIADPPPTKLGEFTTRLVDGLLRERVDVPDFWRMTDAQRESWERAVRSVAETGQTKP